MKRVIYLAAALIFPLLTFAQGNKYEYTPKVKNRVEIVNVLGEITLRNASGNAIVIESDFNIDKPERAEGLSILGAMDDNTNMGVNVREENGTVTISGVCRQVGDYSYTIWVPQGVTVNIDYHSPFANSDISVDSYKGSLEIKALSADVKLTDCTGPLTISTIDGNIEAVFSELNQEEPTSLIAVSGFVDVTLPSNSKASFEISNVIGSVYNNLDLVSENKPKKNGKASDLITFSRGKKHNKYTLNGGGTNVFLKSVSGNIYLRKK